MARLPLVLLIAIAMVPAHAQKPFNPDDAKRGQTIVDKDCHACHIRQFGDKDAPYTRLDRRVNTPAQLRAQIAFCNTQLGAGYFPEEEEHIAAYLNQRYYKFAP
jgi:cytochrome c2